MNTLKQATIEEMDAILNTIEELDVNDIKALIFYSRKEDNFIVELLISR